MSYRLEPEEAPATGVRRIARDAQVQLNVLGKLREQTGQTKTALRKTAADLEREAAAATDLSAEAEAAATTLQWIGDRIDGWLWTTLTRKAFAARCNAFTGADAKPCVARSRTRTRRISTPGANG